jgi:hypothetical protein
MSKQFDSFVENRMLIGFRETIARLKKQGQRMNGHSDVDAYFNSIGMTYANVRQLFSREKKRLLKEGGVETEIEIRDNIKRVRSRGFPYYNMSMEEKEEELRQLLDYGPAKIEITQTMHAQGFCWSFFPHSFGVRCNGALTQVETFNDDDKLREIVEKHALHSTVQTFSDSELRKGLRSVSGAQGVSNFRPSAMWALADLFCPEGGTIFDPSAGWGGRLRGPYSNGMAIQETVLSIFYFALVD